MVAWFEWNVRGNARVLPTESCTVNMKICPSKGLNGILNRLRQCVGPTCEEDKLHRTMRSLTICTETPLYGYNGLSYINFLAENVSIHR